MSRSETHLATLRAPGALSVVFLCALTHLADRPGSPLIAEEVEEAAHLGMLMQLGIGLVQGYLLSRPLTAAALVAGPVAAEARA